VAEQFQIREKTGMNIVVNVSKNAKGKITSATAEILDRGFGNVKGSFQKRIYIDRHFPDDPVVFREHLDRGLYIFRTWRFWQCEDLRGSTFRDRKGSRYEKCKDHDQDAHEKRLGHPATLKGILLTTSFSPVSGSISMIFIFLGLTVLFNAFQGSGRWKR